MLRSTHCLKSSRLFLKWMLSYLSVFIIPVLILSLYYSHVFITMKEEAIERHQLSLENISTQLNSDINDLKRIATNLQMNPQVNLLAKRDSSNLELPLLTNKLFKELSIYMVSNTVIKDINIYFPKNGYIVSSTTIYKDYYNEYMPSRYIPLDYWKTIEGNMQLEDFDFTTIGEDSSNLLFSKVLLYSKRLDRPLAIIIFEIDQNKLVSLLNGYVASSDSSELSISNNKEVLLSTHMRDDNIHYSSYIKDELSLDLPGLTLLSTTDRDLIFHGLSRMISILIIFIFISVLLGVIITYYNSIRNYRPLNEIITSIDNLPNSYDETDEYMKIKTMIRETNQEIESQRSILKNNYIFKLLTGETHYNQLSSNIANEYNLDFKEEQSYVVVLRYPQEKMNSQPLTITNNKLRELLEPHFSKIHFCQNHNTISIIVNAASENDSILKDAVDLFVSYSQHHFNIDFTAGISELCPNTKLSEAYTQSMNALEYIHLFKKGRVIRYQKIHKDSQIGYINFKTFDYLINLVTTCNSKELHSYFTRLKIQYNEHELSTDDAKSTLYFFYNATMRLKAQLQYNYSFKKLADIFKLNNNFFTFPLTDAINYIESLYKQVIELIEENSNENVDIILQEVSHYIERNYSDSNLNLNTIATHFGITPSYLSKKYKSLNGYTINDYLYQTRINHALELQENTELQISQIARMIGFQNSNAFIRIFKRYKGCTPGQYKASVINR